MKYCKGIKNNYISYLGTGDTIGEEIGEEEYNTIKAIIDNAPKDTETHYYKLRADTLEYEAIERPEPIVIPPSEYEQGYEQALLDLAEVE